MFALLRFFGGSLSDSSTSMSCRSNSATCRWREPHAYSSRSPARPPGKDHVSSCGGATWLRDTDQAVPAVEVGIILLKITLAGVIHIDIDILYQRSARPLLTGGCGPGGCHEPRALSNRAVAGVCDVGHPCLCRSERPGKGRGPSGRVNCASAKGLEGMEHL